MGQVEFDWVNWIGECCFGQMFYDLFGVGFLVVIVGDGLVL